MAQLEVKDLIKIFGRDVDEALRMAEQGASRKEIQEKTGKTLGVGPVSFTADSGEILVIMGLSGSGKSTLVRTVNRLIEPTQGTVTFDGRDVTKMSRKELMLWRRKRTGMVFQHFALFPHRTVVENAAYGLEIMGVGRSERETKAREVLEKVGLKGWETHHPSSLSGGMQQRVGLARALAVEPDIILMDEALSALDPLIRRDMQQELLDLQKELQKIVLFISHDLNEAIALGDRIILLQDGKVVQEGTAEDLLIRPASDYVERFVENIDHTEVLTAGTIMEEPEAVAKPNESPQTVLEKMKRKDVGVMFMIDADGSVKGLVRAQRLEEAGGGAGDLERAKQAVKKIRENAKLSEILALMAEHKEPVAVVDENEKLLGVVTLDTLLAALAQHEPEEAPA